MSANPPSLGRPPALVGGRKALTAVALALGTFMQVLDTSIANVSIPTIAGNLGVSVDQGTWVITSFAVANGVSVPLTGWLMQRFGVVRTFVVSVALFTIASLLCGFAWSLPSLIAFRVLQGAVSGPMIPGSQALLINVFGPHKRPTALDHLVDDHAGGAHRRAPARRLHLGQLCVAVDLPHQCAGRACSAHCMCWNNLKSQETPTRKLPIDRVGLLLLFVWVGALQIMLDKGKDLDWFNSPVIVVLLVVTAIAFAAWLIWELTEKHPIVDLSLFKSRSFSLGTVALCLGYAVFFGNVVLMPLWLQSFLGYTATWAGLVSAPSGVTAMLTSLMIGRLMRRFDPRLLAATSFGFYAASYFMRAALTSDASFIAFMAPQLVQGFAMGLFFVSMLAVIFDGLPPHKIPAASGLSNFLRITAGRLRHLAHHHLLGSARSAASDPARGYHQRVCARLSAIAHADASVRIDRSERRGRDDPSPGWAKLPVVFARSLLFIRVAERRADSTLLSRAPTSRGRPDAGGGGLS